MPERIPIKAAREVAKAYSCRQVIVLAWDGELTHIVTYGESTDDCAQAAAGGNILKQKWGWPECNDQPSRVKKLEKELSEEREARERAEKALRELPELAVIGPDDDGLMWLSVKVKEGAAAFSAPAKGVRGEVLKYVQEALALAKSSEGTKDSGTA